MSLDLARIDATVVEHAPRAAEQRPRSQLIAATIFAGVAIMAMATLIGLYLSARHTALAGNAEWIPAGGLPLTGPNTALFTLLISIPAMAWAQQAIRNDDRKSLWVSYGIVLLLGAAFINAEAFILNGMSVSTDPEASVGISESPTLLLIFTIVGVHLVMIGAAMASVLVTGFRALGGRLDRRDRDSVDAVALFWYVAVALFGVLWYAVYVMK
jgi:heme/copper-type cytochrome/quinol oxidase subunit 3